MRVAILAGVAVLALCGFALYAALADYTSPAPSANARVPVSVGSPAAPPAITPEATAPTTMAPQSPPPTAAAPGGQPAPPVTQTVGTPPRPLPTFVPIPRPTHHYPGPLPPVP